VVPAASSDYVSTPKQNYYRSIHSTVIGPSRQRVELQIRTRDMHEIAEYGIAAHALYKDGAGSPTEMLSRESSAYAWLRRTIELLAEGSNSEEFLEHTKLELFHDQVFCFTPKGVGRHAAALTPSTSRMRCTPTLANTAVGWKINGNRALVSELTNGTKSIITSKVQPRPRRPKPRHHRQSARRRSSRHARRRAPPVPWARLPHRSGSASGPIFIPTTSWARCRGSPVPRRGGNVGGRSRRCARRRRRAPCIPTTKRERAAAIAREPKPESGWFGLKKAKSVKVVPGEAGAAILIRGMNTDLPVRFAPNGGAVPGDRIVGIPTPGEGITIYPIQSPALKDFEDVPERWLDLR
jgi:(p)ppGpp synthase/HD superfamily hydrolase